MYIRHLRNSIKDSLDSFPSVLLIGARQVGKSTILEELKENKFIDDIITLDDFTILEQMKTDSYGFLKSLKYPVAIDEVQRVPDLLISIKKIIDENKGKVKFILTGSANILSYPLFKESLAGRSDIIHLEGISASESIGTPEPSPFLKTMFSSSTAGETKEILEEYVKTKPAIDIEESVFFGGFPEIREKKSEQFKAKWFRSYEMAYIEKDVRDLSKNLDVLGFGKVFRALGLQTGQLTNYHNISLQVGLDQRTVKRYSELLEATFQMNTLPAWSSNLKKRLIKNSKIYMRDSGHAAYVSGIHELKELVSSPQYGSIFETWLYAELRKLMEFEFGVSCYFYRTHSGREVDFILQKGAKIRAVECKSKTSITKKDLIPMKEFLEEDKESFGTVIYNGDKVLQLEENILAVPVKVLY